MSRNAWVRLCVAALVIAASGCAGTTGGTAVDASARGPGAALDVSYFYDALAPYGRWVEVPAYGWCWSPDDIALGWRPYSDGEWVYTDFGWTWISSEPWGWAAFHYGRWALDPSDGWVWVPGVVWAPAWVAWRESGDWVGWAPLPPSAGWDATAGLHVDDVDLDRIPAQQWCFVQRRQLADANLRFDIVSVAHNVTLTSRTRNAARLEVREGRPMNRGADVETIERLIGRSVPRASVVDAGAPGRGHGQMSAGVLRFFRPALREGPPAAAPRAAARGRDDREIAINNSEVQRQQDQQRRNLESDLQRERARLEREHEDEMRAAGRDQANEEMRRRHDAENQAFDAEAARQRQLLEHRLRQQAAKPGRAQDSGQSQSGGKGQEKGHRRGDHGQG